MAVPSLETQLAAAQACPAQAEASIAQAAHSATGCPRLLTFTLLLCFKGLSTNTPAVYVWSF